jgi:5'-deoxynucleotidase YfbR-like HD superfamily hydrolase
MDEKEIHVMRIDRLEVLREGGMVQRFHTKGMINYQTVAEHTFGVLALLYEIEPTPRHGLVRACMYHDIAEAIVGDVPFPAKVAFPKLKVALKEAEDEINGQYGMDFELTPGEYHMLKFCDMAELLLFCFEETRLGNSTLTKVMKTGLAFLWSLSPPNFRAKSILEHISKVHLELENARG